MKDVKEIRAGGGRQYVPEEYFNRYQNMASDRPAAMAGWRRWVVRLDQGAEMILESSRLEVPRARSDRISRSRETDGSPASIFATRDWLDFSALARSVWERRSRRRRSRRLSANRILSSMYADSSSERRRNSLALPIFQPPASNCFLLSSRIFILP